MRGKRLAQEAPIPPESPFRLIRPEDYARRGIDARDVPLGTFAAEDHPSFLPSRFGGNAYGLGLIEQNVLSRTDTGFLESLDFDDPATLAGRFRQINAVFEKLGLLIRLSSQGESYYLIPVNLVAHSIEDIQTRAGEIEALVRRHARETRSERLDIGLLTSPHDIMAHELAARLSHHRIFHFESIERVRTWRSPLDMVVLPKDLFEYLMGQRFPGGKAAGSRRLWLHAAWLIERLREMLDAEGVLVMLGRCPPPEGEGAAPVAFRSPGDLKHFLLFTHVFRTAERYRAGEGVQSVRLSDLHAYLTLSAYAQPHARRLLGDRSVESLAVAEIEHLRHLNLGLPGLGGKGRERALTRLLAPAFETVEQVRKVPPGFRAHWEERLSVEGGLPASLLLFVGRPRRPPVTLSAIEEEARVSGMMGCPFPLVAKYRNTFRYVLDVLRTLSDVRENRFQRLQELELSRLRNPFEWRRGRFESLDTTVQLMGQISRLERVAAILNPEGVEGPATPVIENLERLALHGFTAPQLREILLIAVGHTTMSRVVLGKLPARSMKPVTDRAREEDSREIVDILRFVRLMSIAEMASAMGEAFGEGQARELFRTYDDAIHVATDPGLSWEGLEDQRISRLGGVRNRAVREMLKFFNLFEFLDSWGDFLKRGRFHKEVLCDHDPEKLARLEEALSLVRVASDVKGHFFGGSVFGRLSFFHHFLDTEFHGTGHLFPRLGVDTGFMLLWITVNAAERRIVNLNPMIARTPPELRPRRLEQVQENLRRIPPETLGREFFDAAREALSAGRPAFVFDTGLRLMQNPETRALDVSFVDVDENVRELESLLGRFEVRKLRGMSLRNLQDMESLFSELASYRAFLSAGGPDRGGEGDGRLSAIEGVANRLEALFRSQAFIPEEIHDTMSVLSARCPEILRFVLPEFHALGAFTDHPGGGGRPLGAYVLACLRKFEALVTRDRDAFQDREALYALAKRKFGPLAEEAVGVSHAQLELLEHLISRIQQRPRLYQALTLALLFQDIGEVEAYVEGVPGVCRGGTHAERGAAILEGSGLLSRYTSDPEVRRLTALLVRHHGIIGHVLQGEEAFFSLRCLIADQDPRILDALVLHSVLTAAAVREDLMISDLLDAFTGVRAQALEALKSVVPWEDRVRESLWEKGLAVLDVPENALGGSLFGGWAPEGAEGDEALGRGRRAAALERLLRLFGVQWVDFQDLEMWERAMPPAFIYHKKGLKAVGGAAFEAELTLSARVVSALSALPEAPRQLLFSALDHMGWAFRIYNLQPVTEGLGVEDALTLLVSAVEAAHARFGPESRGVLVHFGTLARTVARKAEAVRRAIRSLPAVEGPGEGSPSLSCPPRCGLRFTVDEDARSLGAVLEETLHLDTMLASLARAWSHRELRALLEELVRELAELPYDTTEERGLLLAAFLDQRARLNDRFLRECQDRLGAVQNLSTLEAVQAEMEARLPELAMTEEQRVLLGEMFDYHRARIRDRLVEDIQRQIASLVSEEDVEHFWEELRRDLETSRQSLGKEYESLIADLLDQRMEQIPRGRRGGLRASLSP